MCTGHSKLHEIATETCTTTSNAGAAPSPFGRRMVGALNDAALMLMTSIGHRTGLFDAMASMPPADSVAIAGEANLNERYVREWLGSMVTAGVVEHDPIAGTYALPVDHAAWLTRAAGGQNLGISAEWIAVLGAVEDQVVEAFSHGKGVPYSAYKRFHEVMAEDTAARIVANLVRDVLPLVDGLTAALERGIDVLDVGCGAGGAMIELAARFRRSRFVGCDLSAEACATARRAADQLGLRNVNFIVRDVAERLPGSAYDLITAFDAIHDQARPGQVLGNISMALRPAGTFLMVDIAAASHHHGNIDHPLGTFLYTISCMHCMSVSLANGGPGLGAAWGEQMALRMLADAGFGSVRVERLERDALNNYYIARRTP